MDKTEIAVERIKEISNRHQLGVIVSNSGGKDSCVIFDLCKRANIGFVMVHNVKPLLGTSNDPVAALTEMHPETLEFMYTHIASEHAVAFMKSDKMQTFIDGAGITCSIDGSRVCEHTRAGKSSEFIRNGVKVSRAEMTEYNESGLFGIAQSFPIYDWSDDDVFDYITDNNLPISTEYVKNGELAAYMEKKGKLWTNHT